MALLFALHVHVYYRIAPTSKDNNYYTRGYLDLFSSRNRGQVCLWYAVLVTIKDTILVIIGGEPPIYEVQEAVLYVISSSLAS